MELYYDEEQVWKFEQDFNYSNGYVHSNQTMSNKKSQDRTIHRKVIPLPFAPIDRGIAFTQDSKFVFVALESSQKLLDDNDENESKKDDFDDDDEKGILFLFYISFLLCGLYLG